MTRSASHAPRYIVLTAVATIAVGLSLAPAAAQKGRRVVEARVVAPEDGEVASGILTLHGRASSPAGVKRVELLVDDDVVATRQPAEVQQEVDITYDWDTRLTPDASARSSNGTYEVSVRAVANGDRAENVDTVSVTLDNAPAAPRGLDAVVEGRGVTLHWDASPEPDVIAYVVRRSTGGAFAPVGRTDTPGYYEQLPPGDYSYEVVALRRSPTLEDGRPSRPSADVRALVVSEDIGDEEKGFVVGGKPAAPRGLPGAIGLPSLGESGLPTLPSLAEAEPAPRWGTYEEELPYEVPRRYRLVGGPASTRDSWWQVVPPDGLRWVAAGALLLVVAAHARLIATRIVGREAP